MDQNISATSSTDNNDAYTNQQGEDYTNTSSGATNPAYSQQGEELTEYSNNSVITDEQLAGFIEQDSIELSNSNLAQLSEKVSIGIERHTGQQESAVGGGAGAGAGAYVRSSKMELKDGNQQNMEDNMDNNMQEFQLKEQLRREQEPLRFCRWIADRTLIFFIFFLCCHIFFLMVTGVLLRTGYDVIPITFDRLPLDIRYDVDYLRGLAWSRRDKDPSIITRGKAQVGTAPERSEPGEIIELLFRLENGNVFTTENLQRMQAVEEDFFNNAQYQNKYCLLAPDATCVKPRSILRYFDGTFGPDAEFNNVNYVNPAGTLYKASVDNRTKSALQYHLGVAARIDATSASSDVTRSYMLIGLPLAGYANETDREEAQMEEVEKFILEEFKTKAETYYKSGVGPMEFIYNSFILLGLTISGQVFKDMALAIGSLAFIVIFVCIQTGSLWVGLFAIFSIMSSFNAANLFYRIVLDYRYLGIFHVLAVFIILGIGADDVFVFFDTWKETSHFKYKSLGHRLSDCYRRASLAMLFTSLTTAIALAVSAASPFLGIGSFGVFACVLVIVNYLSVITFFPCVVVAYHKWWEKYRCCCCCPRSEAQIQAASLSQLDPAQGGGKRRNIIVRFFRGHYYRFVTHRVGRWFILLFFTVHISICIYFASQLKVNEEQVKFLPDDSNFGKYLSMRASAFASTSETGSKVHIVFGLKPQNLDKCHKTDPKCVGELSWDNSFNMNSAPAQAKLLQLCTDLKTLTASEAEALAVRRSLIDNTPEVLCFVEEMKVFLQTNYSATYPLDNAEISSIMSAHSYIYDTGLLPAEFDRYFEVATSFWLYNGFTPDLTSGLKLGPQLPLHSRLLGEARLEGVTQEKTFNTTGMTYYYGTRLRYAAISVNITIEPSNFGFPKGLRIRDTWEDYISRQMAQMPEPLQGGFQVCMGAVGNVWHGFKVQEKLSSSAMNGIAIGICVAFPILVLATQNIIVGFLATLTICCITCSVIALIPMAGWKLGMLESLNLVLVVGLSVDYVVHLAEGYSRSVHHDRKMRTRSALEEVGISVISGAATTLGAAIFLFGAFILFFTQFGIFLFSTIGFSLLYALGFFVTLIALIGPEGETGSLKPIWRWCGLPCSSRTSSTQPRVTTSQQQEENI